MTYLILYAGKAFYTNWFEYDNNYIEGMTVFNLLTNKYTIDCIEWIDIEEDHL